MNMDNLIPESAGSDILPQSIGAYVPSAPIAPLPAISEQTIQDDDYERWDWDFVMKIPPAKVRGSFRAKLKYVGRSPPMQMVFPDEIPLIDRDI